MSNPNQQQAVKNAKVAVVGGRDFADYAYLVRILNEYHRRHGILWIITGTLDYEGVAAGKKAIGADTLAIRWAVKNEIGFSVFPAKWKTGQRAAAGEERAEGPIRNELIAQAGDVMIAFPTKAPEIHSGTRNAIAIMTSLKKPVYVFEQQQMRSDREE